MPATVRVLRNVSCNHPCHAGLKEGQVLENVDDKCADSLVAEGLGEIISRTPPEPVKAAPVKEAKEPAIKTDGKEPQVKGKEKRGK